MANNTHSPEAWNRWSKLLTNGSAQELGPENIERHGSQISTYLYENFNKPTPLGERLLYLHKPKNQRHHLAISGQAEPLYATIPGESIFALDHLFPGIMNSLAISPDGRHVAFNVNVLESEKSDETKRSNQDLVIVDIENGKEILPRIKNAQHSSVSWLQDGSGFLYIGYGDQAPPSPNTTRKRIAYLHMLDDEIEDIEIFEPPETEGTSFLSFHSVDQVSGKHLLAEGPGFNSRYYHILEESDEGSINVSNTLDIGEGNVIYSARIKDNRLYFLTDVDNKYCNALYSVDLNEEDLSDQSNWELVMQEHEEDVLTGFHFVADQIVYHYERCGASALIVQSKDGKLEEIGLPEDLATVHGIQVYPDQKSISMRVETYIKPPRVYKYSLDSKEFEVVCDQSESIEIPSINLHIEQTEVESEDGTMVPVTILSDQDHIESGKDITVSKLYAYGGHGNSQRPGGRATETEFLKRGGQYVIVHARGGKEKGGRKWHQAAVRENQHRTIEDIKAAAKYLRNTTTDIPIIGMGGSHGAARVIAAAIEELGLFDGIIADVPLTNFKTIRDYHHAEYGNPDVDKSDDWNDFMKFVSPFHMLDMEEYQLQEFPPILINAQSQDTIVSLEDQREFCKRLRELSSNPVFWMEDDGGHLNMFSGDDINYKLGVREAFIEFCCERKDV